MAYQATEWSEQGMSTQDKVDALNNLETIYDEAIAYMLAMPHDIYTIEEADARYYRTPLHPLGRSDTGEGCGVDAATIDGYTLEQILATAIPSGGIAMWKTGSLPMGFVECNGLNNAPDFRDFIPRGAGAGLLPGDFGGDNEVTPTAGMFDSPEHLLTDNEIPRHTHSYLDWKNSTSNYEYNTAEGGYRVSSPDYSTHSTTTTQPGSVSTRTPHKHTGCAFEWNGYKDDDNVHHDGDLSIVPLSRYVKFIMRS